MLDHSSRNSLGLLAGAVVTFCLSCCLLSAASQFWLPRQLPGRYVVKLCFSVRTTGSFRVATWWSSPAAIRSLRPPRPYISPNIVCGFAPWSPRFPPRGSLESAP